MHDRARIYWRSRYALQASGVEVDFGMSPLDFVNFSDENSMAFQHIDVINASSRPGDTVLDPFGGSCKVYDACMELGRVPIIIEKDGGYYRAAMKRIRNKPITLEKTMAAAERPPATLEDFAP